MNTEEQVLQEIRERTLEVAKEYVHVTSVDEQGRSALFKGELLKPVVGDFGSFQKGTSLSAYVLYTQDIVTNGNWEPFEGGFRLRGTVREGLFLPDMKYHSHFITINGRTNCVRNWLRISGQRLGVETSGDTPEEFFLNAVVTAANLPY